MKPLLDFFNSLRKKRRPFRLTKGGWIFILYSIGVGAGAINTGNNLLYLIFGLFMGVIFSSGFLSDVSLWGLAARLDCHRPGEAGQLNSIPFQLKNRLRRLPSISVTIEITGNFRGEKKTLKRFIPVILPGETVSSFFFWTPSHRGVFRPETVRFVSRFPFGLFIKWWDRNFLDGEDDRAILTNSEKAFYVFPETLNVNNVLRFAAPANPVGELPRRQSGDGSEARGLREFRLEDNPKRIHWKASARRGLTSEGRLRYLSKEVEAENSLGAVLLWPSFERLKAMPEEALERFIRFSADLARALEKVNGDVSLHMSEGAGGALKKLKGRGLKALLGFFAEFDPNLSWGDVAQGRFMAVSEKMDGRPSYPVLKAFDQWNDLRAGEKVHG